MDRQAEQTEWHGRIECLAEVLELDILNDHRIASGNCTQTAMIFIFIFSHLTNCALAGQIYRTGLLNSY